MSSAIENLVRLNNEIGELVSELYTEFSDAEPGTCWDYTRTLSNYIRRVTKIGLSAGRANIGSLQDACLAFQDSLRQLRDSNPVLSPAIRHTLEEWPLVALTVCESPQDSGAVIRLRHLSTLCNLAEIPSGSASSLPAAADPPAPATPAGLAEQPLDPQQRENTLSDLQARIIDVMSVLLHELDTRDYQGGEFEAQLPVILENAAHELQDIGLQLASIGFIGLMDVSHVMTESLLQKAADPGSVNTDTITAIEQWPGLLLAYLDEPACEAHVDALLAHLNSALWQHGLSDDECRQLRMMLIADDHVIELPPAHAANTLPVSGQKEVAQEEPGSAPPTRANAEVETGAGAVPSEAGGAATAGATDGSILNDAARELLDLIKTEIRTQQDSWDQQILALAAAATEYQGAATAGEELVKLLDRFIPAIETIGLQGLVAIMHHCRDQLHESTSATRPLPAAALDFIALLPMAILDYLASLDTPAINTELAELFYQADWSRPFGQAQTALTAQLANPVLAVEDNVPQRATEATPEDVSLALPDDVNQDLLETLLQELPGRSAEFTETISRLAGEAPGLVDVEQAQRIAHTLKGSANTVGITGIATLTHHIEDVLGAFIKQESMPDQRLVELLINAADVIETMSEALLNIGPVPDNAQQVLQAILDCANIIDKNGLAGYYEQIDGQAHSPVAPSAAQAVTGRAISDSIPASSPAAGDDVRNRPKLRVDPGLIDELLKIIGESVIIGGQLHERLHKLVEQSKTIGKQNELFQSLCHELEQMIEVRGYASLHHNGSDNETFDSLELEQYNELHTITHRLVEAATDSAEFSRLLDDELHQMAELLINQERMHKRNQEVVMESRMVPVETIVPRLQRVVRQTCRFTDKQATLKVIGAGTLIDSDILDRLIDSLMHILRNAIDHGIEAPATRLEKGKPAQGRISLTISRRGDSILLICEDDGAGLDYENLRRKAEQLQLLDSQTEVDEERLTNLVFHAGFTTRETPSQVSGRGIGLDAVQNTISALKGSLKLDSRPDAGCRIEISLPLTLITVHALLVESRGQTLAISSHGVEQIVPLSDGEYATTDHGLEYRHGDNVYRAYELERLLQRPIEAHLEHRTTLLVRDDTDGSLCAIALDQVTASRDLVVKQLGKYVPALPGIEGATILGDGSISPVIDIPDLLRQAGRLDRPIFNETSEHVEQGSPDKPVALVIDDSLSARRALQEFVSDLGFEAVPARDGLEGVEILARRTPDLILVDMEMPRMNGLEFVTHLRAEQDSRRIPVIMITSRATEKHRSQAKTAGVDVYLTKPYQEDVLHEHIQQLLFDQPDPIRSSIA